MDSGIAERSKTLYSSAADEKIEGKFVRTIWVSYPVPVAPLNPWHGYVLPASCPYKNCPLAIPHLSAGGLDFLMEDFAAGFIRRLGGTVASTAAVATNLTGGLNPAAATVAMGKAEDCILELKYFRLSHTRTLKESYRFNVWQSQTFLGPNPPTSKVSGHVIVGVDGNAAQFYAMAPIGKDVVSSAVSSRAISMISASSANKTWDIQFDALNLAQVPSFLLISVPRLGSQYTLKSGVSTDGQDTNFCLGENCARNLSRNLSIKKLKIIVNSARGAIDEDGSDQTGFVNAERLFELTQENAGSHYFAKGGFRAWRDYGCAVLLNSSQFAPGLQVCDGVAYPIQIQIQMTVENRCVGVHAQNLMGPASVHVKPGQAVPANDVYSGKLGPAVIADYVRGQAQCTAIFTKVVLATTETSATTNAMNYPLDSAERLMNAAGQMQ